MRRNVELFAFVHVDGEIDGLLFVVKLVSGTELKLI